MKQNKITRRNFLATSAAATGGALMANVINAKAMDNNMKVNVNTGSTSPAKKMRLALIGLGNRGAGTWGRNVTRKYLEYVDFVGICDTNEGRLNTWKKYVGVECPVYLDFEKMMKEVKPEVLIVCTPDYTHNDIIVRGWNWARTLSRNR